MGGAVAAPALLRGQVVRDVEGTRSDSTERDTSRSEARGRSDTTRSNRRTPARRAESAPIKPPALKQGSTIGIVAPASGVDGGDVSGAVATLKRIGFNVKTGQHLSKGFGYLAATDEKRAAEFMKFIRDPEVDCVMAVRGGYGVMRILPMLNFDEIRANPKVIIGYSDITALVNSVYLKSGLIGFHGPVATSSFDPYSLDSFRRVVMAANPAGEFSESTEFHGSRFSEAQASTVVPGKAQGRLVGGNLSIVSDMMGTPYEVPMEGNILFLEEVAEEPYRVDRMLTQLRLSGKLEKCAGVAFGRFTKCEAPRRGGEFQVSLSLEQVIRGALEPLKIPTVYGLSIGHITAKLTVPVGALATLDADAKTITINEAAVV